MFDFDTPIDRRGTTSIKWNVLDGFKPHEDMLPYWIADTDFATVPEVVEALRKRLEHPVFGYSDPLLSTYKAVQGWWERRHHFSPDTEWMFFTTGVVTGINFSLLALTKPKDKVLTFTPVYDPFFAAVENTGRTLVECPLHHEDNYYTIDWERFESELKGGVRAVIFCNPHNPVGRVWTQEELHRVCELCVRYDVWLLCDEMHADYGLTRPYTPACRFEFAHDKKEDLPDVDVLCICHRRHMVRAAVHSERNAFMGDTFSAGGCQGRMAADGHGTGEQIRHTEISSLRILRHGCISDTDRHGHEYHIQYGHRYRYGLIVFGDICLLESAQEGAGAVEEVNV